MAVVRTAVAVTLLGSSFAAVAGCFLITFDDVPTHDAGTTTTTATTPPDETTTPPVDTTPTSTPFDSGPPVPSGESCDTALDRTAVHGCAGFAVPDAQICARDPSLSPYPFSSTIERDVVTCNAGAATCIVHCASRCVGLPSGFPDQCDHCTGRTDGTYCGSELGWVTKDVNLLVRCSGNAVTTSPPPSPCANTCIPGAPAGTARCSQ